MQSHFYKVASLLLKHEHADYAFNMEAELAEHEGHQAVAELWLLIRVALVHEVKIAGAAQENWEVLFVAEAVIAPNGDAEVV